MARKLPWKKASDAQQQSAPSPRRASSPKIETPRRTAATPSSASAVRHRPAAIAALNSSDPLRSPSTSPPPEPPQERYMVAGDDQYRIVEDELLQTAQRFTTHLHRAEYSRLKLIARSKNDAAIREIKRPVVGPLTSDAKRRRDQAKRLSKQRSLLSAEGSSSSSANQDDSASGGSSPWVGTNLRGLLNAPRAETRSLSLAPPQPAGVASSSLTKAAVGHRPPPPPLASTPNQRTSHGGRLATPVSAGRAARHLATSASSASAALSSTPPSRHAKVEADASTPVDDDLDFDDPFGINKRRLDRKRSREHFKKSARSTPTKTPSSSATMSFV
ncbi:hypothetical protein V2A60_007606 [Cordyceps javanica]|uniref:Uncharacterized protein n=1 Tax=Cordyceps javanica TaxID=43265 RepID=A0A545VAD4_9HYPO|nr:hypothetical protein IF1G_02765 [Cordyceps javanica]TQW09896.1 hypothetical protein IF2G_02686 [Cordyceps javanica]